MCIVLPQIVSVCHLSVMWINCIWCIIFGHNNCTTMSLNYGLSEEDECQKWGDWEEKYFIRALGIFGSFDFSSAALSPSHRLSILRLDNLTEGCIDSIYLNVANLFLLLLLQLSSCLFWVYVYDFKFLILIYIFVGGWVIYVYRFAMPILPAYFFFNCY